ncbi:MAG: hypothetical protein SF339_11630 [Blastocatellia bacterium]|nr:hypothetical protein [Blastocatellia bacterium]
MASGKRAKDQFTQRFIAIRSFMKFQLVLFIRQFCLLFIICLIMLSDLNSHHSAVYAWNADQSWQTTTQAMGTEIKQQRNGLMTTRALSIEEANQIQAASEQTRLHRSQITTRSIKTVDERNLVINLDLSARVENNPSIKTAINRVAARWAAIPRVRPGVTPTTPFTMTVRLDFDSTAFGKPFTSPNSLAISTFSVAGLIPVATFSGLYTDFDLTNYSYQHQLASDIPTPIPTDLGNSRVLNFSRESAIATGITFRPSPSITIAINSEFRFDMDPSDGIDADKLDFESIVSREFGRILGFFSFVDTSTLKKPYENPFGGILPTFVSIWDLFRFRPGVTREDIAIAPRLLTGKGEAVFFTGDLEAPLAVARFSPTEYSPDPLVDNINRATGYWKDDALTGKYYGIMDESYLPGERGGITALEVGALSYFFYAVAPDTPVFEVLSADDNGREAWLPASTALYAQRLTPERAPANLESIRVN